MSLASLASSSTWVAGQESDSIDNTTNLYLDYRITFKTRMGTTPTAGTRGELWCIERSTDAPAWPDVFDGTGSAETVTSRNVLYGFGKLIGTIDNDVTTTGRDYWISTSLRRFFDGRCPDQFVLFFTHNFGAALDSTAGNHVVTIKGVYETIA